MDDKQIEIERYDERALKIINYRKHNKKKIKAYINVPYKYYFKSFKKVKKNKLLEVGAGTGENTLRLIKMKFNVCATDISPKSVEVMSQKYSKYKNFFSKVADMEKLPFKNESFDVICSAGSFKLWRQ